MAGFAATAERWKEFDLEWRERLAGDGLTYFHMVDFAHSVAEFRSGWKNNERRRQALLSDLLGLVQSHAYRKFGCVIATEAFAALRTAASDSFAPTLIALAGRIIVAGVEQWRTREKYQRQAELVFEDGDLDKGTLMNAVKKITDATPTFRHKKDDPARGIEAFTPLQSSDILAYEIIKIAREFDSLPANFQFRFPYRELDRVPGVIRVLTPESVRQTEEYMGVVNYFDKYPLGSEEEQ
jgi:hypothetical protein